jgi:hypothetical protein
MERVCRDCGFGERLMCGVARTWSEFSYVAASAESSRPTDGDRAIWVGLSRRIASFDPCDLRLGPERRAKLNEQ